MSRIGKKPVQVPAGTTVVIDGNNISVKGKLGALQREMHPRITVTREGDVLNVQRASDNKFDRSLHGMSRTLVQNMVTGVNEGFTRALEVQGVGYRVELKKNALVFNVGYSHPVEFELPQDVKAEVDRNIVKLTSIDKERLGLTSAKMRAIRPPDNYKGKGIRFQNERIKLKPGKSGV